MLVVALLVTFFAAGQNDHGSKPVRAQLTENSIVKDTLGTVYPMSIWRPLMMNGRYAVRPETPSDPNSAFVIIRLSEEQYRIKMASLPKPNESNFFRTGAKFSYFKTSDINGNKINAKTLAGKILVLNYWFINCPPCRMEMPELNKLVEKYKNDSLVVFLAVSLDDKSSIQAFLKTNPFHYTIVDDGRYIARDYNISSYPTNVIIDHEGKVYFHSTGLSSSTVYWLGKSIDELKQNMQKKDVAVTPK